jgi:aryl-alcohol dehydrogenase-like predicted oxidoreductase
MKTRTIGSLAVLAREEVASVIAGATSAEQIESNARAATWELTSEELADVDRILSRES